MAARDSGLNEPSQPAPGPAPETGAGADRTPRSFYADTDGHLKRDLSPHAMSEAVRSNGGQLWVDIDSSAHAQLALLETVFHFHPLAIEDTLNPRTRVKLEEYPGYLFMVVRVVDFEDETEERYDVRSHNVYFFLGQNYLVTVHAGHARSCGEIVQQLDRNPELLGRGAERLMHAIMDMAVDAYFPLLDRIDDATHQIEERVFVEANPATLREIFAVKRLVLALRKYLAPQRDVFNVLTNRPSVLLSPESQVYFRDIHDHVLRITESLETYRELLSGALDAYLTQASNQLAVVTKGLTVVATLSIPFVMVSGIWGMNFARIPLSHTTYGFWLLLGAQVALGVGLLALLRWRRWL